MSLLLNVTATKAKVDCSKECPCGVPVIPVPDQWLEVMVTGGFKVWHIIFIIIAFIITIIVVYCCFHRCRIPRTKQEIEADLMRTNITNKFREYLHEFPNEPTTFIEALKRVQEIEEKSEKDDAFAREASARKRRGWLKLKGGKNEEKDPPDKSNVQQVEQMAEDKGEVSSDVMSGSKKIGEAQTAASGEQVVKKPKEETPVQLPAPKLSSVPEEEKTKKPVSGVKKAGARVKRQSKDVVDPTSPPPPAPPPPSQTLDPAPTPETTTPKAVEAGASQDVGEQKGKAVKRRRHKPNLSRTRRTGETDLEKGVVLDISDAHTASMATTTTRQHVHRVRIEPNV